MLEQCPNDSGHTVQPGSLSIIINNDNLLPENGCTKDYRAQRADLLQYVMDNYGTMDPAEWMIASEHFCAPKEVRDQFYTFEQQVQLGQDFHRRATQSRNSRWNMALVRLYNYLTLEDSFTVGMDVEHLAFCYLTYGIEGTVKGDVEGLYDYLASTSGTSYAASGLLNKNFEIQVSGVTIEQVSQEVINILDGLPATSGVE